jgi:hypothetical protein
MAGLPRLKYLHHLRHGPIGVARTGLQKTSTSFAKPECEGLFSIKRRRRMMPLSVFLKSIGSAGNRLGHIDPSGERLLQQQ